MLLIPNPQTSQLQRFALLLLILATPCSASENWICAYEGRANVTCFREIPQYDDALTDLPQTSDWDVVAIPLYTYAYEDTGDGITPQALAKATLCASGVDCSISF